MTVRIYINADKSETYAIKRKGFYRPPRVQARNLQSALDDPLELAKQRPRVPAYRSVIERLHVDAGGLEAVDRAVYAVLMAIWQESDKAEPEHYVKASSVMTATGISTLRGLQASLKRLCSATADYDIVDVGYSTVHGTTSLMHAEIVRDLRNRDSERVIVFKIPDAIQQVIETNKLGYTHLNLIDLLKFESKYSQSLYAKLAWLYGLHYGLRRPMEYTPEVLAKLMGHEWVSYDVFRRRCLEPALAEITDIVKDFKVTMQAIPKTYAAGERRPPGKPPVAKIVLTVEALREKWRPDTKAEWIQRLDDPTLKPASRRPVHSKKPERH